MKSKKINYSYLALSTVATVSMIVFALIQCEIVSFQHLLKNLFYPMARLMVFILIGLFMGQIIEALGWTKKISVFARPVFEFSKLGDRCGAAFTSAFFSGVVANSMLVDFLKDNKISKMQLFLTNYLNQLPAYFLHLPTTIFIVLPLTGIAGLIYFSLTFIAVLLRFCLCMVFGKIYFSLEQNLTFKGTDNGIIDSFSNTQSINKKDGVKPLKLSLLMKDKLLPRMTHIFIWVVPIYTLVYLLNVYDMFDFLNTLLSGKISSNILPVHSLSVVVISFAAEFTSGFAAAGALMDAGVLSVKETVIALLMGNIIAFPIRALRHQIPRYLGIFSPKIGLSLLLTGQFFRIASLILVGIIYYMVG